MYVYEIGYHSCEDSSYCQWHHEKQYTHEQLLDIVIKGLKVALVAWKEKQAKDLEECKKTPDYNEEFDKEWGTRDPQLYELIASSESFNEYLVSAGFSPVKKEEVISLFGWACATAPKSWKSYTNEGDDTRTVQKVLSAPK